MSHSYILQVKAIPMDITAHFAFSRRPDFLAALILAVSPISSSWPEPSTYHCPRAVTAPVIDGRIDDVSWGKAEWSAEFIDITGDPSKKPYRSTRMKMMWDEDFFYVGAELSEPHIWATIRKRDSVIFHDNDFEVFVDPDGDNHRYAELEINAFGTEWDLLLVKPYRDGGPAVTDWNMAGLKTAVDVEGTINDPSDLDTGWTVEIAIPWAVFDSITNINLPPNIGDCWRVNFSRVQWKTRIEEGKYIKEKRAGDNWVWSAQGIVDMHQPERWGIVCFKGEEETESGKNIAESLFLPERKRLMECYHAQKQFRKAEKQWAQSMAELQSFVGQRLGDEIHMRGTLAGFTAWIELNDSLRISVYDDSRIVVHSP